MSISKKIDAAIAEGRLKLGEDGTIEKVVQATERPWRVNGLGPEIVRESAVEIRLIAECHAGNKEERMANAELIIRAVNSYEAMLEALEHAARSIHHTSCTFNKKNFDCQCHVGKAVEAFKLAKGEYLK